MRVTSLGHAGLFIETTGGSILCDPWFTPTYFGSWFPFPRNDGLDPTPFSSPTYLYVSHAHRDHLDLAWLDAHVDRSARVILPAFDVDHLERSLGDLGFTDVIRTADRDVVELDGDLRIAVISLAGPHIGPMGDSALLVADPTAAVFNQNDAHPHEIAAPAGFEHLDAHFLQHSGAIWYPMVYELPADEERAQIGAKRRRQVQRAFDYIAMADADHVVPTAGPPCFLDPDVFDLNDLPGGRPSIFPDAHWFLDQMGAAGMHHGHLVIPGSVLELHDGRAELTHPVADADVEAIFTDKARYLDRYRADMADVIAAERASWPAAPTDLVGALADWIEPLLADAPHTRAGVGGPIGLVVRATDGGVDERIVLDVPAGRVRPWTDDDEPPFRFTVPRPLVEAEVAKREPDWCNELFLSCRFEASRDGPYNEFVYTFFKSLAPERMAYAERWYAAQAAATDVEWVTVDGWVVERRCPHQGASLARMGSVCDGVLTCSLHGWEFDLATGRCLTTEGVSLRVRGCEEDLPATSLETAEEEVAAGGAVGQLGRLGGEADLPATSLETAGRSPRQAPSASSAALAVRKLPASASQVSMRTAVSSSISSPSSSIT